MCKGSKPCWLICLFPLIIRKLQPASVPSKIVVDECLIRETRNAINDMWTNEDEWEDFAGTFTAVLSLFMCLYCVLTVTWMLKYLCLGLTNEHYQDDTRLFGGTHPQSFPLVSAAVIYLLLRSFQQMLRVVMLCDLKRQALFTRQQLSLIV